MLKRHAVEGGEIFHFAVIRNDDGNLAGQLAGPPAVQQVGHAVQVLRAEQRHRAGGASLDVSFQFMPSSAAIGAKARLKPSRSKVADQFRSRRHPASKGCCPQHRAPLDAHEEQAQIVVDVLVGVQNIRAALIEQPRHARHEPLAIRAVDQQNGGILHLQFRLRLCTLGIDRIAIRSLYVGLARSQSDWSTRLDSRTVLLLSRSTPGRGA